MIKFFFRKQNTIGGAAALIGFFTILAQFLAILKNKLLSVHFGVSSDLDIFYAAFKIPDVIFLLVGTMAVGSILIPIFTEKENSSIGEKEIFMTKFFNSFSIFLIFISAIVFFLIPTLIKIIFPIYSGNEKELIIFLSRLFLLSPILMGIGNFFISINQRNKIFLPMALTGLFYNLAIIFGIIFLVPKFGVKGLSYSVIFGALLYLLIQLPTIFRFNLLKYKIDFLNKKEIQKILKIALPRSVALSISSLIIIFIYSEVSKLNQEGLIVIFSFAYSVFWLPAALINSSYSSAMLPVISKFYSQGKIDLFNNTIREIISRILFLSLPMTFFTFGFSELIVAVLFGSQKFSIIDINSTAFLLSILSITTPFLIIMLTVSKIFYSMGRTKPVMWTNIFAGVVMIFILFVEKYFNFNIIFQQDFVDNFDKILLIITAFSISYILASILIILKLKMTIKNINIFNCKDIFLKFLIAVLSLLFTKIIWNLLNFKVENSFSNDSFNLINSIIFFIFFTITLSEILKENNYLNFKKKILNRIKK